MINRDEVQRVAAVFDELEVGQVAVAHNLDFAYVNDTAAKLLSYPPGATTAAAFAAGRTHAVQLGGYNARIVQHQHVARTQ